MREEGATKGRALEGGTAGDGGSARRDGGALAGGGRREDLERLRREIDSLDERIVTLLNERMKVAVAIGEIKAGSGKAVLDPDRERRLLERLHALNSGPLSHGDIDRIYETIMAVSRGLQQTVR